MKFVWEGADVRPGVVAHCSTGTYLVVTNQHNVSGEATHVTLVNVEHLTVIPAHYSVHVIGAANLLTKMEAWPDGASRTVEPAERRPVGSGTVHDPRTRNGALRSIVRDLIETLDGDST